MPLQRYLIGSSLVHLGFLVSSFFVSAERDARRHEEQTRRAIEEHTRRANLAGTSRQVAESKARLSAGERAHRAAAPAPEPPGPRAEPPGPGSAKPEATSRGDAGRVEEARAPEVRLDTSAHGEDATGRTAGSHADSEPNSVSGSSAPRGKPGARTTSTDSADSAGRKQAKGWNASLDPKGWTKEDRLLRGSEALARQVARSELESFDGGLDAELAGWQMWLSPKRVLLGPASGASWFFVDTWYVIGPFDSRDRRAHGTSFPPEALIDLDAVYAGEGGRAVRWRRITAAHPAIVPEPDLPYAIYYAYTELRSDRDREIWLGVGADDSAKVWLNGALVFKSQVHLKPWVIAEGFVPSTLRAGYNTLLVRLENAPEGSAFSVLIRTSP